MGISCHSHFLRKSWCQPFEEKQITAVWCLSGQFTFHFLSLADSCTDRNNSQLGERSEMWHLFLLLKCDHSLAYRNLTLPPQVLNKTLGYWSSSSTQVLTCVSVRCVMMVGGGRCHVVITSAIKLNWVRIFQKKMWQVTIILWQRDPTARWAARPSW